MCYFFLRCPLLRIDKILKLYRSDWQKFCDVINKLYTTVLNYSQKGRKLRVMHKWHYKPTND